MDTGEIVAMTDKYVMNTYSRIPIAPLKGVGARLTDAAGNEYLDFVAGIAVNSTGHCHPKVVEAICRQASELLHVSNLYHIRAQAELARVLVENSGLDKVFFCNSGAEANEAAIKLARRYSRVAGRADAYEIITAVGSFHGRTMGALAATGQTKYHEGFEPLVPGFSYVPFNDLSALEAEVSDKTCAIMLELIQGEGGVHPADPQYLEGVARLCRESGLLLIIDEVQTGIGRTGSLFAYQQYDGLKPDIVTLAKGLASGVPIGAVMATEEVSAGFGPGKHASTFGGNPLACAAALATLDVILNDGVLDNVKEVSAYLIQRLQELQASTGAIADIRGRGLMVGIELKEAKAAAVLAACRKKGLLVHCAGDKTLRLLPPLIIEKSDVDEALRILCGVLSELQ
ncbi:MAG: acetylornithine transaminase [Bacillota bacterium]|jgi:predicted acetylornithine/succinylornithine family transaminase|nr:acetylornithine transaminase [Bacillota bacterium]HQD17813.1 acetylornithine transaminase [Bacillota bacterium]